MDVLILAHIDLKKTNNNIFIVHDVSQSCCYANVPNSPNAFGLISFCVSVLNSDLS